jgi:hypothetical protein
MNFSAAVVREKGGAFACKGDAIDEPRPAPARKFGATHAIDGAEQETVETMHTITGVVEPWWQWRFPIDKAAHDLGSSKVLKALLIPELI